MYSPAGEATQASILAHPRAVQAIDFFRWACGFLVERPSPSEADLAIIEFRALVLAPTPQPADRDYSRRAT
jgi:hypothetical protein